MRFNWPEDQIPDPIPIVEVGNVYLSKCRTVTHAWVVVAIKPSGNTVVCLGIDSEGEITTGTAYAIHAMENKKLIGRCDLSDMTFDMEAP